ncbi:DUF4179 domain-containing protein [Sutcliffiella deserti]|uniref:DUF4179 domain-containing protein n=1 Tax=Sutcliffiella deserti TaxID=2875501 RepID=UPI001CBC7CD8|nr:DUF4179 domain-containing protein [Sutcliffiella deserti]
MDKDTFTNKINEVEVPKEEVLQSIKLGVSRAAEKTTYKKKKPIKKFFVSATVAAGMLLSSTFIVPSFSEAMADAPLIGGWYSGFNDAVGRNLEEQNLITELNQSYSSNGVDVTLTNAYYDGYLIGIMFYVKGNLTDRDGHYYALYELFNGDPLADETKELTTLEKTDDGYTGHIQIVYPYKELPKSDTIPVSFEEIGNKKGTWQFNVPVQQIPVEKHVFENKQSTNPEGNVIFKVDSILYGKASTAITYSLTYPKGTLDSSFQMLNVEPLDKSFKIDGFQSDGKIEVIEDGDRTTVVRKIVISKVLKNQKIIVSPTYSETVSPVEPLEIELP